MARISGVDLPGNKRIEISLRYIFGIGESASAKILRTAKVDPGIRAKDLTDEEIVSLRRVIDQDFKVEGDLRKEVSMNIKRLMDIGSYRGLRHRKGLPVRGQRSKTNARTRKGPKKGIGARAKKS